MQEFSVLMSLYIKEKASNFEECMQSMLKQTVLPTECVVVLDGPISEELRQALESYQAQYGDWIVVVPLEVNHGLGLALAEGVRHCKYDLIARMDTDDIARSDRFEKQLACFEKDPDLSVCGSHIIEFEGSIDHVLAKRKVPLTHDAIAAYQKQRSAFNHMTVMFTKEAILKAGNYQHAPLMEDDLMWVHMLQSGAKCLNIDDYLVYARTGYEMICRRGGWSYFKKYRKGRRQILETGYISYWDYWKTVAIQAVVALVPQSVRFFIFNKLLR